ncbi:hypothetical protein NDU88_006739 [Pleurodeles waltl]|uniref:Uncharacterized protein n=1 Tax=Pleurodeles waltl TaxID=8319 RepID=A0AAV7VS96_PLEWA|nr:hypothetical protein NDU88_006739 [Pleurodeles waltl]
MQSTPWGRRAATRPRRRVAPRRHLACGQTPPWAAGGKGSPRPLRASLAQRPALSLSGRRRLHLCPPAPLAFRTRGRTRCGPARVSAQLLLWSSRRSEPQKTAQGRLLLMRAQPVPVQPSGVNKTDKRPRAGQSLTR